ncbi:Hypothetical predicted protein [Paramuricea clavata]|uniref:Uncharacterized protein n=1 Tax=Paramuricea clavata TaxID=317549 RepID=A0A7D9EDM2_PARCT|nr:Hypothetical predicted protein [Paramuricea clavata]
MKGYLAIFAVLIVVYFLNLTDAASKPLVIERKKRSFKSYFENYFDEMATSACVAMGSKRGLYFAVRRKCGSFASCKEICTSYTIRRQAQIWDPSKLLHSSCVESLHIYKNRPSLADNKKADTDVNKVGLTIYRYKTCNSRGCGPNYCCCTGLP